MFLLVALAMTAGAGVAQEAEESTEKEEEEHVVIERERQRPFVMRSRPSRGRMDRERVIVLRSDSLGHVFVGRSDSIRARIRHDDDGQIWIWYSAADTLLDPAEDVRVRLRQQLVRARQLSEHSRDHEMQVRQRRSRARQLSEHSRSGRLRHEVSHRGGDRFRWADRNRRSLETRAGSIESRILMEMDRKARELAAKVSQAEEDARAEHEAALRTHLEKMFEAKLEMESKRLERMREGLESRMRAVEERRSNKETIVDDRMRVLLGHGSAYRW